jgi:hypothetical protein
MPGVSFPAPAIIGTNVFRDIIADVADYYGLRPLASGVSICFPFNSVQETFTAGKKSIACEAQIMMWLMCIEYFGADVIEMLDQKIWHGNDF